MPSIFYADYFIPNTMITVEDYFNNCTEFKLPKEDKTYPADFKPPDEYKSYDNLYNYLKDVCGYDKISIGNRQSSLQIFYNLMLNFLRNTNINPEEVSYIIDTEYWDFVTDSKVSIPLYLQKQFGFKNASVFSVSETCGAIGMAIELAAQALFHKGKYVIILSSNLSRKWEDRFTGTGLIGDGASILVISKEITDYEIIDFNSYSDGHGSYHSQKNKGENFQQISPIYGVNFIQNFLIRTGVDINDINMIIPQSTHRVLFSDIYAKGLGIDAGKIFLKNIPAGGHMGNVDIPRNFKDFTLTCSCPNGAYILLYVVSLNDVKDFTHYAILLRHNALGK